MRWDHVRTQDYEAQDRRDRAAQAEERISIYKNRRREAIEFCHSYKGNFQFMLDMCAKAENEYWMPSTNQVDAILRCKEAEAKNLGKPLNSKESLELSTKINDVLMRYGCKNLTNWWTTVRKEFGEKTGQQAWLDGDHVLVVGFVQTQVSETFSRVMSDTPGVSAQSKV